MGAILDSFEEKLHKFLFCVNFYICLHLCADDCARCGTKKTVSFLLAACRAHSARQSSLPMMLLLGILLATSQTAMRWDAGAAIEPGTEFGRDLAQTPPMHASQLPLENVAPSAPFDAQPIQSSACLWQWHV